MLKEGVHQKFMTKTEETGRFVVYSPRTRRTYYIEPIGDAHIEWGSVDPATKEFHTKKGWKKHTGSINKDESLITEENGFKNIRLLEPGVSPLKAIEYIDDQYPDVN